LSGTLIGALVWSKPTFTPSVATTRKRVLAPPASESTFSSNVVFVSPLASSSHSLPSLL
jgi:hypothetical protein